MPKTRRPRPDAMIFGEIFRQFRLERGWTLRACAENVGITPSYLSLLEAGRNLPSIHVILLFGYAFDVKGWEIFRSFEEKREAQVATKVAAAEAAVEAAAEAAVESRRLRKPQA